PRRRVAPSALPPPAPGDAGHVGAGCSAAAPDLRRRSHSQPGDETAGKRAREGNRPFPPRTLWVMAGVENGSFRIAHISDLHAGGPHFVPTLLERAISEIN